MLRIAYLVFIAVFLLTYSQQASGESWDYRKSNVIIIFADDLGYGDVGCYGANRLRTPNIDRLAREGRMFTDAHSASAVCTPSRYALLTGRYPFRANGGEGVWGPLPRNHKLIIDSDCFTIADLMKQQGYATACIGKWHLGFGEESPTNWNNMLQPGPLQLGFDYYFGIPFVNCAPPFVYVENDKVVGLDPDDPLILNGNLVSPTPQYPEKKPNTFSGGRKAHALYKDEDIGTILAEKSVKWIQDHKDHPFFLYLSTTNIHHPFTPHPRFTGSSECGRYGDFVQELDWIVGEVIQALEKQNILDHTLIIFTSDNGGMLNLGGQIAWQAGHRLNGALLGFKFSVWEGGHRVPFIASWPGRIKPGTKSDQLLSSIDLFSTLAAMTGYELKTDMAPDSYNLLPAFTGDPEEMIRDHLVLAPLKPSNLGLRVGDWMYIGGKGGGGFEGGIPGVPLRVLGGPAAIQWTNEKNSDIKNGKYVPDAPGIQLYSLKEDLSQTTNLAKEWPGIVDRMDKMLKDITRESTSTRDKSVKLADMDDPYPDVISFTCEEVSGIGSDPPYTRRDPSDVIEVDGKYYVWYTKVKDVTPGYWGTIWFAVSDDQGHNWQEKGEALGKGDEGTFDSHAVFTPNILYDRGKYYLFYTGVKPTPGNSPGRFENNSTTDFTAIGVAVADSPDGPFKRISDQPVLSVSQNAEAFDSYRVDDAALLVKDGKYCLYYKGRCLSHGKGGPGRTQMGIAFADHPAGPYRKHSHNPILDRSHEVLIWNHRNGVATLASKSNTLEFAPQGLDFGTEKVFSRKVENRPAAPGLFRPHLTDHSHTTIPGWGISMGHAAGCVHLIRFEMYVKQ